MTQGIKRFAAYTRVSDQSQADKGHSLQTQEQGIKAAVQRLGGKIVQFYGGEQERGTPGASRPHFKQMIADAQTGKFDAIMYYDAFRWSRDPVTNNWAASVLMEHSIELWELDNHRDLFDPSVGLMLDIQSSLGKFAVEQNIRKGRTHRIEKAKLGYPTSGGLKNAPWGRVCNWEERRNNVPAKWEVKPGYKELAARIYDLFVNRRKTWQQIAPIMRADPTFVALYDGKMPKHDNVLANVIRRRMLGAGDMWVQRFKNNRKKYEGITTTIKPLLTAKQIATLATLSAENRVINSQRHEYALSRLLKCGHCGGVLMSSTGKVGGKTYRYYRHHSSTVDHDPRCIRFVPLEATESSFFYGLGEWLMQQDGLSKAIADAVEAKRGDRSQVKQELATLKKAIKTDEVLLDAEGYVLAARQKATRSGLLVQRTQDRITEIETRITSAKQRAAELEAQVAQGEVAVEDKEKVQRVLDAIVGHAGRVPLYWPPAFQNRVTRWLLGAEGSLRGKPEGIYVDKPKRQDRNVIASLRVEGAIGSIFRGFVAEPGSVEHSAASMLLTGEGIAAPALHKLANMAVSDDLLLPLREPPPKGGGNGGSGGRKKVVTKRHSALGNDQHPGIRAKS